MFRRRYSNLWK